MTGFSTIAKIRLALPTRMALKRTAKGMSRKELADLIGATFSSISTWEHGHTIPCTERLYELADALGCSTDFLLGRAEA